jgi:antitoxin component YwqK of YwqJK toxin-antitoxin module
MRRPKSDIPARVTERIIREFSEERFAMGGIIHLEVRECIKNGKVVGERLYDGQGRLQIERPLKDGKKHGREIHWNDDGTLNLIEPYFEGKMHGIAKRHQNGEVIGTYTMFHGTGYDVWRNQIADGRIYVSEIHSMRDGSKHGFEWRLNEDQKSVHEEKHWYQGSYHGIEREWHWSGKLRRGYPKYWVHGEAVTKRQYVQAAQKDPTLPPFR